ncbi:MAG: WxcM-like domain-containing protein [Bacteroidales bacterium]|nr:WxcM-like domain-containing protein [Bacteroidales bacterium]
MLSDARIIEFGRLGDRRGNLSILEEGGPLPFGIRRSYWIYDVPGGERRGGHAFRRNEEFVVALSGSFDVVLDDGTSSRRFSLNRSYYGLYIPAGLWKLVDNFSTNAVALIVASTEYSAEDYIMDYGDFLKWVKDGKR